MNYFAQFLKSIDLPVQPIVHDNVGEFHSSWIFVRNTLMFPDERQLARGIGSTDVPNHLKFMVDSLVRESSRSEEATAGGCLEYLLKNDVLTTLVKLSEPDLPFGIQGEVLRTVANMVVLLDEHFLVHTAVHRPVLHLLRTCVGDEIQEAFDGRVRMLGAASNTSRPEPSHYEEDLVDLLCTICSRIRTYRELLMIFFHEKNWSSALVLPSPAPGEDEDIPDDTGPYDRTPSPSPSQATITPHRPSSPPKLEYEFLLFNYLLRFVHREGRIGDFARAGMLFLMDVAMSASEPPHRLDGEGRLEGTGEDPVADAALALAEYILEGDFSEVLAAGLSAVFSILPTKLDLRLEPIGRDFDRIDPNYEEQERAAGRRPGLQKTRSDNPEFRGRLDHFLTMMEFIQDVVRRNALTDAATDSASAHIGAEIVLSVLGAVRTIFLENILYPSILECSDIDGSSVAVMSYLECVFRSLGEGPLIESMLQFLLDEGDDNSVARSQQSSVNAASNSSQWPVQVESKEDAKVRRRKSSAMILLEMEAPEAQRNSDYVKSFGRFTLKDLVVTNIQSLNSQSSLTAMCLLQTLLLNHCTGGIARLFDLRMDDAATNFAVMARPVAHIPHATPDENDEEDSFVYPGMANTTKESLPLSDSWSYQAHAKEMKGFLDLLGPQQNDLDDIFSTGYSRYLDDAIHALLGHRCYSSGLHGHMISTSDTLIRAIIHSLCHFFFHSPEHNIALSGSISALALCPYRSLSSWLVTGTQESRLKRQTSNNQDDRDARSPLFTILFELVAQAQQFRTAVREFPKYLQERRERILFSENLLDAIGSLSEGSTPTATPTRSSSNFSPLSPPPGPIIPLPKHKTSSLFSFFTPTKKSKLPGSPRSVSTAGTIKEDTSSVVASPFGQHYIHTRGTMVAVVPTSIPGAISGSSANTSWTVHDNTLQSDQHWLRDDEATSSTPVGLTSQEGIEVSLSQTLDNVIILEELIKDLASIVEARRCLGVDSVTFIGAEAFN